MFQKNNLLNLSFEKKNKKNELLYLKKLLFNWKKKNNLCVRESNIFLKHFRIYIYLCNFGQKLALKLKVRFWKFLKFEE